MVGLGFNSNLNYYTALNIFMDVHFRLIHGRGETETCNCGFPLPKSLMNEPICANLVQNYCAKKGEKFVSHRPLVIGLYFSGGRMGIVPIGRDLARIQ